MSLAQYVAGIAAMGFVVLGAGAVQGQEYPNKTIRIITSTAGGGSDFMARQIAQGISGRLGQPIIVDNRATLLAAEVVSKSPPDGYTLQVAGSTLWISPLLRNLSYDVVRDFSPVSLLSTQVNVLVVHPSMPVRSVQELIALAKARPGQLTYSSGTPGSPNHLGPELFKAMAGVNILPVPYKGIPPTITAVIGGEVQMTMSDAGILAPHVKSGKVRALAVTSARPSALFPGLPTLAETVAGYESVGMTVILAPAKTPGAIINRLNQEILRFLSLPDVKERFLDSGEETSGSSPEQLAATIKSDTAKWSKLIKDLGIKVE